VRIHSVLGITLENEIQLQENDCNSYKLSYFLYQYVKS